MCWNEVNEYRLIESLPVWAVCVMQLAPVLSNGWGKQNKFEIISTCRMSQYICFWKKKKTIHIIIEII